MGQRPGLFAQESLTTDSEHRKCEGRPSQARPSLSKFVFKVMKMRSFQIQLKDSVTFQDWKETSIFFFFYLKTSVLWHSGQNLQCKHPKWAPTPVLAAPPPSKLPANAPVKAEDGLGPWAPAPTWDNQQLLTLNQSSSGSWGHMGSEAATDNSQFSLSLPPSVSPLSVPFYNPGFPVSK